ncbi:MAG: tRNA 2-thiouridine(34) synthase MnmA [Sphaerochaetaceae bacterium]
MRILVGLSGGVDSAVAALLLQQAGHEVVGATMSIWQKGNPFTGELKKNACFGPNEAEDIAQAQRISEMLGIEYHVLDCAKEYEQIVLEDFRHEYKAGRTPNPCIWCNSLIKFGALPRIAAQKGIQFDRFATGHYARVEKRGQRWGLLMGLDPKKDQSYFLYRLTQQQLSQVMFPLGELKKEDVKHLALQVGLFAEETEESQDFYSGQYSDLLDVQPLEGNIEDAQGTVLGTHNGYWNFTIGQRRGLKISSALPLYVLRVDASTNTVIVGTEEQTFAQSLVAEQLNWMFIEQPSGRYEVKAKIRSTGKPKAALIDVQANKTVIVRFAEAQKAVTPGQSIVFYQDEAVLGGGVIQ